MILDAKTYEDNQGMERISDDNPEGLRRVSAIRLIREEMPAYYEECERTRRNNVWKRKQRRIQEIHASLSNLFASLLAAINLAERQMVVLQDLHSLSSASSRTKTKDYEKGSPLCQRPFYTSIAPIPTPSENSEKIWPNTLVAIDEVIKERKCFIEKIKALVENMEIWREIV